MVKDPVCQMVVDENRAPAKSIYKGRTYYFCAIGCKTAFDKEPGKYVESSGESGRRCCCH